MAFYADKMRALVLLSALTPIWSVLSTGGCAAPAADEAAVTAPPAHAAGNLVASRPGRSAAPAGPWARDATRIAGEIVELHQLRLDEGVDSPVIALPQMIGWARRAAVTASDPSVPEEQRVAALRRYAKLAADYRRVAWLLKTEGFAVSRSVSGSVEAADYHALESEIWLERASLPVTRPADLMKSPAPPLPPATGRSLHEAAERVISMLQRPETRPPADRLDLLAAQADWPARSAGALQAADVSAAERSAAMARRLEQTLAVREQERIRAAAVQNEILMPVMDFFVADAELAASGNKATAASARGTQAAAERAVTAVTDYVALDVFAGPDPEQLGSWSRRAALVGQHPALTPVERAASVARHLDRVQSVQTRLHSARNAEHMSKLILLKADYFVSEALHWSDRLKRGLPISDQ